MKFLTGNDLNEEIYDTIYEAKKYLIILSPFIQLDDYFKNEVFKNLIDMSRVHIIIGFGKNPENVNRSFKKSDIEYFTQFPNISIVYIPNLHGKFYGNEKKSVTTSLNLIDYSFTNNIEFGVLAEKQLLGTNAFFDEAENKCMEILKEGSTIFVRRPKFKRKLLLSKDYDGSADLLDLIDDLINNKPFQKQCFEDFPSETYSDGKQKQERVLKQDIAEETVFVTKIEVTSALGNCIQCKTEIPIDLKKPLCRKCFAKWKKHSNSFNEEEYCHICGKSHSSSLAKPACYACFKKLVVEKN